MLIQRILIAMSICIAASEASLAQNIPDSCGTHDWFQLREKVSSEGASLLCKGTMDAGFEKRTAAKRELSAVIHQMPRTASSLSAHETLLSMYLRHGQYREALEQLKEAQSESPRCQGS